MDCQLEIATNVYRKAKANADAKAEADDEGKFLYCFRAFAHEIRWGIQHWMMADWQKDALISAEEGGADAWESKEKQKKELANEFKEPMWSFSCPVCGETESFVCEIDDEELDRAKIQIRRGVCVHCSLVIPNNCPFLADELCREQFDKELPRILSGYGIA